MLFPKQKGLRVRPESGARGLGTLAGRLQEQGLGSADGNRPVSLSGWVAPVKFADVSALCSYKI